MQTDKIKNLVKKYEDVKNSGKLKSYTEEEVKKGFIEPLFEALGWDISNKKEVSAEESIASAGRVDYGFYLNDRAKFYLEAKSFNAEIHDEKFANQAIKYSFNKGAVWANPGIGFLKSLKVADPSLNNDIEAIQLGLSGVTGRTGERRGNGLKTIQRWTIDKFDGIVKIHSGSGLVVVSKEGQETETVFPILGTLASFVVKYK